jgi:hypothetical protein
MTPDHNNLQPESNLEQSARNKATTESVQGDAPETTSAGSDWLTRFFTLLVWSAMLLGIAWFAGARLFLKEHWRGVAVILVILVVMISIPSTQRWYERISAQRRIGLVIMLLIVLIGLFFVVVFLLEPIYQAALLRTIFLIIVCSLPALMYYLFITTKKYSLLNEFVLNLTRLGLVNPSRVPQELVCNELQRETEQERRNRINTYMQKFEAVYGAIPTNLSGMVLQPIDSSFSIPEEKEPDADSNSLSTMFTVDTTIPVIIATVLIALGWLITLPPWQGRLVFGGQSTQTTTEVHSNKAADSGQAQASTNPEVTNAPASQPSPAPTVEAATERWLAVYTPISSPVRFAFIGAYFFTLQMLFRRYVRRDLRSSAYVAVSLRIILAVIGIWVLVEAVAMAPTTWFESGNSSAQTMEKSLLVLGFVLGVFPRVGWQVIQTTVKRAFSLVVPSLQTQLPLSDLDGLTVWHEARLEEEDIENIPNMATADLIDLMINTRFPPDRIIDWVDQALLYTHLGPQPKEDDQEGARATLRTHGIRHATSLVEAYNRSEFHGDCPAFEEILKTEGRNRMRSLVDAVGTNPTLKLIQTWKGLLPHSHFKRQEGPAAAHVPASDVRPLTQPSLA